MPQYVASTRLHYFSRIPKLLRRLDRKKMKPSQSLAYKLGHENYVLGIDIPMIPFLGGTAEREEWIKGFTEAFAANLK